VTALNALRAAGGLHVRDINGERDVAVYKFCEDIGDAVTDTQLIVAPTPAFAQADIARALAPHLVDDQVIYLPPGSFGSFLMMRELRDAGCTANVGFAETGTLPWLTRKHADDTIAITTRATRLPTGAFPALDSKRILGVVEQAFPAIEPIEDALSGALMNAGPIIHPPLILMNAGPIEHFDHWDIHNEGTQPAIRRVTDALDLERVQVREALGYGEPHFPLANHYDNDAEEWMYGNLAHEKLTDSGDWREDLDLKTHRYMTEDVAIGLALLVSACEWAGVSCPVARGLLALGSAVTGNNYRKDGRTFESLGLHGLDGKDLRTLLDNGI